MFKKKIFIKTFGCQMNKYDSKKIIDILSEKYFIKLVSDIEESDIILFNTCSIRKKSQEKFFSNLGKISCLKKSNSNLVICVGGCIASQEGINIIKKAPYVDIVFGPQTIHKLPGMIYKNLKKKNKQIDISFPEIDKFDSLPLSKSNSPTAFVSIMEGCSKYCSFCIVPYTRGQEISRPFEDILLEIADLTEQGVKEIILLGQNVNAYRGKIENSKNTADLSMLLSYISEFPEIKRIRYTTSHPKEMTEEIIKSHGYLTKLVPFLHLPIQSGSDKILYLMKRGYSVLEFKNLIKKLREIRPGISFSSDFIIGFPGESEIDFNKTINLIEDIKFDNAFSFIYSKRPGTLSSNMKDETSLKIKLKRLRKLQIIINDQYGKINDSMIGSKQNVLVEGCTKKKNSELIGRTENNRLVKFNGSRNLIGKILNLNIESFHKNIFFGSI